MELTKIKAGFKSFSRNELAVIDAGFNAGALESLIKKYDFARELWQEIYDDLTANAGYSVEVERQALSELQISLRELLRIVKSYGI